MTNPSIKQVRNNYFFSSQLLIFLLIIFIFVLVSFVRGTIKYFLARNEIKKKEVEIKNLETKAIELKNLKDYLETDFYKEKEAREKFGFTKPGEKVIILSKKGRADILVAETKEIKENSKWVNFKKWWQYLFK